MGTDTPEQAAQQAERDAVNAEKGRSVETPRTVDEQVEQLDEGGDGHRRRDPLAGAEQQRRD